MVEGKVQIVEKESGVDHIHFGGNPFGNGRDSVH